MRSLIIAIALIFPCLLFAQDYVTLSGYISEYGSQERLIGATLYSENTNTGTVTNPYGFYSIRLNRGKHNIRLAYMGYEPLETSINFKTDTTISFVLKKTSLTIDEVTVQGIHTRTSHTDFSLLNYRKLDMASISKVPVILGEHDVMKAVQYLPGIKGGAENTAGFNVRGSSGDQNLILLDGVPVYNAFHLMGFFSVFNGEAIKSVEVYKGGIPARFGGRLASVLDVRMKEGNMQKNRGSFFISPVSGNFTIEGPMKKDTASYIVSLRRTFIDLPMYLFQKINGYAQNYGYYFYDLNFKTNWIIDETNRVYFSVYTGLDRLFHRGEENESSNNYHYQWGNITSVLRWNKTFSPKVFSNTSIYYSHFQNTELSSSKEKENTNKLYLSSQLNELCLKTDIDWYVSNILVFRTGGKFSTMEFSPNIIQLRNKDYDVKLNKSGSKQALTGDIYWENELKLNHINTNIGIRGAGYFIDGTNYLSVQPRFSMNIFLSKNLKLNLSYMNTTQYLHLLSNSTLGLPTDLWVASTKNIKPQRGDQFSVGIEKNLLSDLSVGVEGYYKKTGHVTRFNEGAAFLSERDTNWENNVAVGQGEAYGIETIIQKQKGRFNWMASYTLAWSNQRFDEINNSKWFPFKYDRRHDISCLLEYQLNPNNTSCTRSINVGFTLQSGNNITIYDTETEGLMPPGFEVFKSPEINNWFRKRQTYSNPNNYKMPAFHHLDINYLTTNKKLSNKTYEWSFSVYNVYSRLNPWYLYKKDGKVKQVGIFPIVPSVSFKYSW
ncbi:MAG: TonB-dependent receptor [Prolixibacteraceae bacterium]|jgi:hypothetical protein|nr:TonB-dependent receptor [Prolixibacteraceae bacterium]